MKFAYAALLLVLLFAGCTTVQIQDYKCPDCSILLISIDTLRADHLSAYGYVRNTSPFLNEFAKNNILFNNFFTVIPKTGPSMTSVFTGKYVNNHGVVKNGMRALDSDVLIAEALPDKIKKGGFFANVYLSGLGQGFDDFEFIGNQKNLTNTAINWVDKNKENQFFLWLHYIDPHGPYRPPREYLHKFVNDSYYNESERIPLDYVPVFSNVNHHVLNAVPKYQRLGDIDIVDYYIAEYDAEISYIDDLLKKLITSIEELSSGETIIIITADHGESLGESDLYFEHGQFVNEPSIHIPLIIKHPEIKNQIVIDELSQNTDLFPTILSILNLTSEAKIDGVDLSELLVKPYKIVRDYVYSRTPSYDYLTFYETVRTKSGKLVKSGSGNYEYYDLRKDKYEKNNIFNESHDQILELVEIIEKFGPEKGSPYSQDSIEYSEEAESQLRSLGYLT